MTRNVFFADARRWRSDYRMGRPVSEEGGADARQILSRLGALCSRARDIGDSRLELLCSSTSDSVRSLLK